MISSGGGCREGRVVGSGKAVAGCQGSASGRGQQQQCLHQAAPRQDLNEFSDLVSLVSCEVCLSRLPDNAPCSPEQIDFSSA